MTDLDTVRRMKNLVAHYGLHGQELVFALPDETLAEDFNGIGPEWMHERLRRFIDALHPDFLPCAFVHDVMWAHADGSEGTFEHSNDLLLLNGYKVARRKYGWWSLRRYWRMRQARIFSELCQVFGRTAYVAACRKNNNQQKEKTK